MTNITIQSRYLVLGILVIAGLGIGTFLISSNHQIAESESSEMRNAELVEQISREVVRQLQEEGALDNQIDRGIRRYVENQRQAQANTAANAQATAQAKAKNVRAVSPLRDHIYGNVDAPVSLIEYSDFECPFCKRFHPTARKLIDSFDGQVNWVYRHFPLGFHNPLAQLEAEASECAGLLGGNEAFWRYTDLVYERTTSNGKGLLPESLALFADEIGLDQVKFEECLESGQMTARVQEDFEEGGRVGISGTPGNIIRNHSTEEVLLVAGALPFEDMRVLIERLLKNTP
jgi:protein-disulfide isomerase